MNRREFLMFAGAAAVSPLFPTFPALPELDTVDIVLKYTGRDVSQWAALLEHQEKLVAVCFGVPREMFEQKS